MFSEHAAWQVGGRLTQHEVHVPQTDSSALLLEHFVQCIATGEEPLTSGRSQRVPLACVLAAYESMQSGEPVVL